MSDVACVLLDHVTENPTQAWRASVWSRAASQLFEATLG